MRFSISIFFLLCFFPPTSTYAQDLWLAQQVEDQHVIVSTGFICECDAEVYQSIEKGLKAEIVYQIRLYEQGKGFFSLWGGRLVEEIKQTYKAFKDIFENAFVVETSEGETRVFRDWENFIKAFFTLSDISFLLPERDKEYYILARIQLSPVKLVPPLDLITLIRPVAMVTEWHREDALTEGKEKS